MLVAGVPPSNVQAKSVASALDWLVNVTTRGAQPSSVLAENAACGGSRIVTVCVVVLLPQALVAVSVTVYVPLAV